MMAIPVANSVLENCRGVTVRLVIDVYRANTVKVVKNARLGVTLGGKL